MTFKQWFDDMERRYQASYGSYEELLQEAFEAGAAKERDALVLLLRNLADDHTPSECADMICALQSLGAIQVRGEA